MAPPPVMRRTVPMPCSRQYGTSISWLSAWWRPISAVGGKRMKRSVSGMRPAWCSSIIAWSTAMLNRPSRTPVSTTRNRPVTRSTLHDRDAQLAADLLQVLLVWLEREARDVARRRVAVRPVAGRHVVAELAGAARGAERNALGHHVLDLRRRQAEARDAALAVEGHLLDAHAGIVDQV